jgi:hypothetical protein
MALGPFFRNLESYTLPLATAEKFRRRKRVPDEKRHQPVDFFLATTDLSVLQRKAAAVARELPLQVFGRARSAHLFASR